MVIQDAGGMETRHRDTCDTPIDKVELGCTQSVVWDGSMLGVNDSRHTLICHRAISWTCSFFAAQDPRQH